MAAIFSALICGLVFGFGLLISGMTDPNKIFSFLDVLGRWDPSLGIVMAAALVFAGPGRVLARGRGGLWYGPRRGGCGRGAWAGRWSATRCAGRARRRSTRRSLAALQSS